MPTSSCRFCNGTPPRCLLFVSSSFSCWPHSCWPLLPPPPSPILVMYVSLKASSINVEQKRRKKKERWGKPGQRWLGTDGSRFSFVKCTPTGFVSISILFNNLISCFCVNYCFIRWKRVGVCVCVCMAAARGWGECRRGVGQPNANGQQFHFGPIAVQSLFWLWHRVRVVLGLTQFVNQTERIHGLVNSRPAGALHNEKYVSIAPALTHNINISFFLIFYFIPLSFFSSWLL